MSAENSNENAFYDVEIEKNILGAMLLDDGESVPLVMSILATDDFYRPEHRIIFQHITQTYLENGKVDVLLLNNSMRKTGDLDKVGIDYVFGISGITFTTAYQKAYSEIVKEKSQRRKFLDSLRAIADNLKNPLTNFSDSVFDAGQAINKFQSNADFNTRATDSTTYFKNFFKNEVEANKGFASRKTGFFNIDDNQILSSGLYVIGGTPATGKTTFCWQLLDQLSKSGETCIYCSYEMSRLELFSKTVSRELWQNHGVTLTAADIRRGAWTGALDVIIEELQEKPGTKVIELSTETVDDLIKLLTPIVKKSNKPPVICIDYLQIIPTDKENTKQGIDDTVRKLKLFQRETNTTFIVVSSFNRMNYTLTVSFESFKESGNIEFTADVIWALQPNIVNKFNSGTDVNKVRKLLEFAKKNQPREIQLKCLKNRSGNNYDCYFQYYSAHDFFKPCNESELKLTLEVAEQAIKKSAPADKNNNI